MNDEMNVVNEQEKKKPSIQELKGAMEEKFAKFQNENMILGFRVAIRRILSMIIEFENSPEKKSNNDYKRLVKKIKEFCNRGLSMEDKTKEESVEETVQN